MLFTVLILFGSALDPIGHQRQIPYAMGMQSARTIAVAMFEYANDNDEQYPNGKSSTEAFQKLIDGSYVTDPNIFYFPMAGKVPPVPGQRLKPENVCWDITAGINSNAPDLLPIVFLTGYKVSYQPDGSATPLVKPYPQFGVRSWSQFLQGAPKPLGPVSPGIAVCYKNNSSRFWLLETPGNPGASIPHFVSPDFKPDGRTYRQLTPDGVLP